MATKMSRDDMKHLAMPNLSLDPDGRNFIQLQYFYFYVSNCFQMVFDKGSDLGPYFLQTETKTNHDSRWCMYHHRGINCI